MSVSDAVVLAAGEGQRLRPLTHNRPKPMLPAANRPIAAHVLDVMIEAGLERITMVVGYRRDRVQDRFGSDYRGVPIRYVAQEKQLGSGHALAQAQQAVSDRFLVVNGDQLIEPGIVADVLEAVESRDLAAAMAVIRSEEASRYGAVRLDGDNVTELVERPDDDSYRLLNAGVYALDGAIFEAIGRTPSIDGERRLPDAIATLIDDGAPVHGVLTDGEWIDATYPWDLLSVSRHVLEQGRPAGAEDDASTGIWIDPSARIDEAATVRAPVAIGPDWEIGPGAVVGPETALGRNVTLGAGSVVQRSVLDDDVRVGPNATLLDCVAGQGVHLGAGTVVPGGSGDVRVGDRVFEGRTLGAVFGDRARAIGDVSVSPGTLVGPNALLSAGARIDRNVPTDGEVR